MDYIVSLSSLNDFDKSITTYCLDRLITHPAGAPLDFLRGSPGAPAGSPRSNRRIVRDCRRYGGGCTRTLKSFSLRLATFASIERTLQLLFFLITDFYGEIKQAVMCKWLSSNEIE